MIRFAHDSRLSTLAHVEKQSREQEASSRRRVLKSLKESLDATFSNLRCGIQIRMVAGFAELIEGEQLWLRRLDSNRR
jgi:hypothetical protein